MSDQFMINYKEQDIQRRMTCLETPRHNGVTECMLAHLTSMCLLWLHAKSLPRDLWAIIIQSASHVINRLPPWLGTGPSPYELPFHHKPNVSHCRDFGSIYYVHVSKANGTKLDLKTMHCIFFGYDTHNKRWRCMDLETKTVLVSRDVVFDEISTNHIAINVETHVANLLPFLVMVNQAR